MFAKRRSPYNNFLYANVPMLSELKAMEATMIRWHRHAARLAWSKAPILTEIFKWFVYWGKR